jgi:hypothetical protein
MYGGAGFDLLGAGVWPEQICGRSQLTGVSSQQAGFQRNRREADRSLRGDELRLHVRTHHYFEGVGSYRISAVLAQSCRRRIVAGDLPLELSMIMTAAIAVTSNADIIGVQP